MPSPEGDRLIAMNDNLRQLLRKAASKRAVGQALSRPAQFGTERHRAAIANPRRSRRSRRRTEGTGDQPRRAPCSFAAHADTDVATLQSLLQRPQRPRGCGGCGGGDSCIWIGGIRFCHLVPQGRRFAGGMRRRCRSPDCRQSRLVRLGPD
jgi:hypothetical protein